MQPNALPGSATLLRDEILGRPIERRSFLFDLEILLRTIPAVFRRSGA